MTQSASDLLDTMFRAQLRNLSMRHSYRRRLDIVREVGAWREPRPQIELSALVAGVLLVEMHQRPGPIRAAEWLISSLVPRAARAGITRGPFQILEGPWDLREATETAFAVLTSAIAGTNRPSDAILVAARVWNGAASRQPGSQYGYYNVLTETYEIALVTLGLLDPRDLISTVSEPPQKLRQPPV